MEYPFWPPELIARAKEDPDRRKLMRACLDAEPAFLNIREKLTCQEQDDLDRYIAICEELEFNLVHIAYELGTIHAGLTVVPPANKS